MDAQVLQDVVDLGRRLGHIFVATADEAGLPHVAAAADLAAGADGRLLVGAWFCPGTLANLQTNRRVALLVWDPAVDAGHQVLGEVERIDDVAMLDGYAPRQEAAHPVPQVERRLVVRVDSVLHFSCAPHTDRVETPIGGQPTR